MIGRRVNRVKRMTGVQDQACEEHRPRRKGTCKHCGVCRLCDPKADCPLKKNHIGYVRGSTDTREKKRKLSRESALRGAYCEISSDSEEEETLSSKDKLLQVCELLGVECRVIDRMPKHGWKPDTSDISVAKRIYKELSFAIALLICPEAPTFHDCDTVPKEDVQSLDRLKNNLCSLAFFGNRETSIISESIIAASLKREDAKQLLEDKSHKVQEDAKQLLEDEPDKVQAVDSEGVQISAKRLTMGRSKYSSLRKTFELLATSKNIPKYNYTFRIDTSKLVAVMDYLQETLQFKPGRMRNVKIAGHTFTNLPVYERGGQSFESMFDAYKAAFEGEERIGYDTFVDILKLLTTRGESKAGLSTYYVKFRHLRDVFFAMLKRIPELELNADRRPDSLSPDGIASWCKTIRREWQIYHDFLSWEYAKHHLKQADKDRFHCCTWALGGECDHAHQADGCSQCSGCFQFFDLKVRPFLEQIDQTSTESSKLEVDSMLAFIPQACKAVKDYASHRLRAEVQFRAIEEVQLEMKGDPSILYIVIDHRQKVEQMRFREGQVEYYGKKGMSMLGAMFSQWNDDGEKRGFQYSFVDYVIDGYTGQDNLQVAAVVQQMMRTVQDRHPGVKKVIIQSDNATGFASQELIPFIFHMNTKLRAECKAVVTRWLFTEAQTGKTRLDAHFSFIKNRFQAYIEDGNDILIEGDIFKALCFNGGLAGTTVVWLNADALCSTKTLKKKFKAETGSRETHELCFSEKDVRVIKSSGVRNLLCETIDKIKLSKYESNELIIEVRNSFTSQKPGLLVQESQGNGAPQQSSSKSAKAEAISAALQQLGILDDIPEDIPADIYVATSPFDADILEEGWSAYPGNTKFDLSNEVTKELYRLYTLGQGKGNTSRRVTAEKAYSLLVGVTVQFDWSQRLVLSVAKIKAFFQKTPAKMKDIIQEKVNDITPEDVERIEAEDAYEQQEMEDDNCDQNL